MKQARSWLSPVLLFAVVSAAAVVAYWPGLSGPFLFDDFANLPSLGQFGTLDTFEKSLRFLTSGFADPLGRPIALATFLFDANNWPADPYPFKRTNLVIHLVNGLLLAWLVARLSRVFDNDVAVVRRTAVLAAAAWLLHPFLVSTTLYVVQREAMLAGTFTLVALIAYVIGRERIAAGHRAPGLAWMIAGIGGGTVLAMLCKANGVLVPLLALVLEAVVLRARLRPSDERDARTLRIAVWVLVYLPSIALAAYLLINIPSFAATAEIYRSWTLDERLLTQPRILLTYLRLLFAPRAFSPGLMNDDIVTSTGLFSPGTTAVALVVVALLLGGALTLRSRFPRACAALLFFFAAHVLESTVVPLEMYFEHRNYIAAMLLFWPLAALASRGDRLPLRLALAGVVLLGLATLARLHATMWSDGYRQAQVWAAMLPNSARAQANLAQFEIARGQPRAAEALLMRSLERRPTEPQLALNMVGARCALGTLTPADVHVAAEAVRTSPKTIEMLHRWAGDYLDGSGVCARFTRSDLALLVAAARENPKQSGAPEQQQMLEYIDARILLADGQGDKALAAFDRALDLRIVPDVALRQAALLGSTGFACEGLAHLQHFESIKNRAVAPGAGMAALHDYVMRAQNYWPTEIAHLRGVLENDARSSGRDPASCAAGKKDGPA